jgi:hypothetical protein
MYIPSEQQQRGKRLLSSSSSNSPENHQHNNNAQKLLLTSLSDSLCVIAKFLLLRDLASFCLCSKQVWNHVAHDQALWINAWNRLLATRFSAPANGRLALTRRFPQLHYNPLKIFDVTMSTGISFDRTLSAVDFADLCTRIPLNSRLRSLVFEQGGITAQELDVLVRAIKDSDSVSYLHIGNNTNLGNFHTLLTCPSLSVVSLVTNHIDDAVASKMAQILRSNTTLKQLHLWGNDITTAGALVFLQTLSTSNKTLTRLNLYENHDIDHAVLSSIRSKLRF